MPLYDANDVLLNNLALDSSNDGDASGTDVTATAGRIIEVTERSVVAVLAILGVPSSDPAADGATLDITLDVSIDGSTWIDSYFTFRQITGVEVPDDSAAGDLPLILADSMRLPAAAAGQDGIVRVRPSVTASATTNWNLFLTLAPLQSLLGQWRDRAAAAAS